MKRRATFFGGPNTLKHDIIDRVIFGGLAIAVVYLSLVGMFSMPSPYTLTAWGKAAHVMAFLAILLLVCAGTAVLITAMFLGWGDYDDE